MATVLKNTDIVPSTRPAKKRTGRPPWSPTRMLKRNGSTMAPETEDEAWERSKNWVRHCVSIGMQHEVICTLVHPPCNSDTLKKHFAFELANGKKHQEALIAGKLVQQAMAGDGFSQRFWLMCQAGWRPAADVHIAGVLNFRAVTGDEEGVDQ